jgi:hypothetical protein
VVQDPQVPEHRGQKMASILLTFAGGVNREYFCNVGHPNSSGDEGYFQREYEMSRMGKNIGATGTGLRHKYGRDVPSSYERSDAA